MSTEPVNLSPPLPAIAANHWIREFAARLICLEDELNTVKHRLEKMEAVPRSTFMARLLEALRLIYQISPADILSPSHSGVVVQARMVGYVVARRRGHSLTKIAAMFGGRHHTTVMHALKIAAERQQTDDQLARIINRVESAV